MESVILYDSQCDIDARVELEWPEEMGETPHAEEPFEYAFIPTPAAVKHPAQLRWRRPLPPVRLVRDDVYKKFMESLEAEQPAVLGVSCLACPINAVTATMTGQFEHARLKAVRDKSKKVEIVEPLGFGHLNMREFRFILQSVSEFVALPTDVSKGVGR